MPLALLAYYQCAGNSAINTAYNQLLSPEDIYQEQDYLIFMHENQGVVDWAYACKTWSKPTP